MTEENVPSHGAPADGRRLDGHHRRTVERIFAHPTSHNIQWHDVRSLLEQVGSVKENPDGKLIVRVGASTDTFEPKRSNDVSIDHVLELRRMLSADGFTPDALGRR